MEIRMESVTKSFEGKMVIDHICLTVKDKDFTTLLGPSGCGKTTLLRMIAGLEIPDSGRILFDGKPIFSSEEGINVPPERRHISFVFQDFALWPHLSVAENVAFPLRATKDTAGLQERVQDALQAVHLGDYSAQKPSRLSGGQQQRVALARAIVTRPRCILFDEPLSALDAKLREEMRQEIRNMTDKLDTTCLFVTHDQEEAMSMSDMVALMDGGHILQYGTPEEVYQHPVTPFVATFVGHSNWIDEAHMFRPESAKAVPDGGFPVKVLSVRYLGSCYQLEIAHGSRIWTIPSNTRIAVGTMMHITVSDEHIRTFSQGVQS